MRLTRNLLLVGAAVSGLVLFAAAPASARTICREDGYCFNTSGQPVYDQPAYDQPRWGHPYYRRHWHHRYD